MTVLTRRLKRLAGTHSAGAVARAARREIELRRAESDLGRALRSDRPLLVGPYLGEVGYELLYWRPFVLRLLRQHGVDRERVTVLSRGGAGTWYRDVAATTLDAFELASADEVDAAARRRGSPKQLTVDGLDRMLADRARERVGDAALVHPRHMYWRMRFVWEGLVEPGDAISLADYDDLPRSELPSELEARLPPHYVAVKAYFNECLPDTPDVRDALSEIVAAVGEVAPVVLLAAPVSADVHRDWQAATDGVIPVVDLLEPASNLAQQAEVVARADALVSPYGGFSYLGPFSGVRTLAFARMVEDNPNHYAVLRAVRPQARFDRVPADAQAVRRGLSR